MKYLTYVFIAVSLLLLVGCEGPITGGTIFDDIWLLGVITVVLLIIVIVLLIKVLVSLPKTNNPDSHIRCPYCNAINRNEETGAKLRCHDCMQIIPKPRY